MTIKNDKVVLIHHTLKDDKGETIDSSDGQEPLGYLHGKKNIVVGLESVLDGQKAGQKLNVIVKPEDGYGIYDEKMKQEVEKSKFGKEAELQVGARFQAETPQGVTIACIKEIKDKTVIVDFNHELAGKTLYFDIEILDVRDASAEELEHGHVHGTGGHKH